MSHTELYPESLTVTWVFTHLRPSPLSWGLPGRAPRAQPVGGPLLRKPRPWLESHSHTPPCGGPVHLPWGKFPRLYDMSLDLLEDPLRRTLELASWTLQRWMRELVTDSKKLSSKSLLFFKMAPRKASPPGACPPERPPTRPVHTQSPQQQGDFSISAPRGSGFNTLKST